MPTIATVAQLANVSVASASRALNGIKTSPATLERVTAAPGCWIATVGEIAAHHAATDNHARFAVPLRLPEAIADRRFTRNG